MPEVHDLCTSDPRIRGLESWEGFTRRRDSPACFPWCLGSGRVQVPDRLDPASFASRGGHGSGAGNCCSIADLAVTLACWTLPLRQHHAMVILEHAIERRDVLCARAMGESPSRRLPLQNRRALQLRLHSTKKFRAGSRSGCARPTAYMKTFVSTKITSWRPRGPAIRR